MTNEEAIMILKAMIDEMILVFDRDRKKALNMAIEALKAQLSNTSEIPNSSDLISRREALDALRDAENHSFNSFYQGLVKAHKIIADMPSAQPEQDREFMKLTVRNSNGRPYYSIIYLEFDDNGIGNDFEGYSSYSLDVISDYLKKYFMQSAEPERTKERTETRACDCISRQAAIDALEDTTFTKNEIRRRLSELPSALPEPHWIPCSERLPDTNRDVLLQFNNNMGVGFWENGEWGVNTGDNIYSEIGEGEAKPIAWMELPEPYRGGES